MRGIYKITNTVNNKCYIGKSENLEQRLCYHIKSLTHGNNKNLHMQSSYNFYGSGTFTIEVLEELDEDVDINEREKYWINEFQSNNREKGYNKTDGGDGGNSYVKYMDKEKLDELKQKQSERMTGSRNPNYNKHCFTNGTVIAYIDEDEVEDYLNNGWFPGVPKDVRMKQSFSNTGEKNGFYGKKHSIETKKKLSEERTGDKNWNYGKVIIHRNEEQKYVDHNDAELFLNDGWELGLSQISKNKISKANKGKKNDSQKKKAKIYEYEGNQYYGWRALKIYLNENGYPKISETSIIKLSKGLHVKGYDDLFEKITVK